MLVPVFGTAILFLLILNNIKYQVDKIAPSISEE